MTAVDLAKAVGNIYTTPTAGILLYFKPSRRQANGHASWIAKAEKPKDARA